MSEQRLWSVTSLIRIGLGTSDALVNWAVRTTAEYAVDKTAWRDVALEDRDAAIKLLADARWAKSGKAMARGTDLHAAAEQLALGQEPDVTEDILPYVIQYRRFLEEHQPSFVLSEAPVYAPTYSYAGTCDGIFDLRGKRLIFDLKTTSYGPDDGKTRPPFPEVALQLCAYARAELVGLLAERREVNYRRYYVYDETMHHEPMPKVDGAVAIIISPVDYRVVPIRIDDEVWAAWGHVREAARWQVDISKRVIGPDISVPAREVAA